MVGGADFSSPVSGSIELIGRIEEKNLKFMVEDHGTGDAGVRSGESV
jgi:hypothetical protein